MPSVSSRRLFQDRNPLARRAKAGLVMLGAVAVSGCSQLGFDRSPETARAGDTPYYSTSSVVAAAETGAHTGVAAWDGDVSASGKTAAHATLLPGSWARVTNTRTGGSSIVRVTRRLQNARDRDIELSRDAAIDVGALHEGFATVLIEPIDPRQATAAQRLTAQPAPIAARPVETLAYDAPLQPAYTPNIETSRVRRTPAPVYAPQPVYSPQIATSSVPPVAAPSSAPAAAPWPQRRQVATAAPIDRAAASAATGAGRYLQLGAFRNPSFAQRARATIEQQGLANGAYGAAFVQPAYVNGAVFHRVRLGPLESPDLARRALADAQRLGHTGARLVAP